MNFGSKTRKTLLKNFDRLAIGYKMSISLHPINH